MRTPRPCRAKFLRAVAGAACFTAFPSFAIATTRTFTDNGGTGNGNWFSSVNWSPSGAPLAGDDVLVNGGNLFDSSVNYDYTGPDITLNTLRISHSNGGIFQTTDVLSMTANSLSVLTEYVGDSTPGGSKARGMVAQSGGTHNVLGTLYLGYQPTDAGTYNLNNTGSLITTSTVIGFLGTGLFTQSAGLSFAGTSLYVGNGSGSHGTYNLGSTGELRSNTEYISYNVNSTGVFNQSGGLNSFNNLSLAYIGGSATYNLSGGTLGATSGTYSNGSLFVGGGNGVQFVATFNQTGGTNNNGYLYLGQSGGSSTYNLSNGAINTASQQIVGFAGSSTFNQTGGTNLISGVAAGNLIIADIANSSGVYALAAGALVVLNVSEIIGDSGNGTFIQTGGSNIITGPQGGLVIARRAGAAGTYTLSGGELTVPSISINANGHFIFTGGSLTPTSLNLSAGDASFSNVASKLNTLTFAGSPSAWSGKLDLHRSSLIIASADMPTLANQLQQGANLGAWNGPAGITSSSAQSAATTSTATALAYATGAQFTANNGQTAFVGQTFSPTDTLIMYALAGDANMDTSVTFADFLQLQNHYNQAGTDWQGGDFNYDGSTTFADFLILQNNYNKTLQPGNLQPAASSVPEPTSLLLLLPSLLLLARRRSPSHSEFRTPSLLNHI